MSVQLAIAPTSRPPLGLVVRTIMEGQRARNTIAGALDNLRKSEREAKRMAEGTVAADELRLLIERVERLSEEQKALRDDVKDVYSEAKARGYDTKTMRRIVALRKMETHDREEAEALLQTYASALGLQASFL